MGFTLVISFGRALTVASAFTLRFSYINVISTFGVSFKVPALALVIGFFSFLENKARLLTY